MGARGAVTKQEVPGRGGVARGGPAKAAGARTAKAVGVRTTKTSKAGAGENQPPSRAANKGARAAAAAEEEQPAVKPAAAKPAPAKPASAKPPPAKPASAKPPKSASTMPASAKAASAKPAPTRKAPAGAVAADGAALKRAKEVKKPVSKRVKREVSRRNAGDAQAGGEDTAPESQSTETSVGGGSGVGRARFDPHTDGCGPSLEGCWAEQIRTEGAPLPPGHVKIACWNVNGLRAILKSKKNEHDYDNDLMAYVAVEDPAILCLNETRISPELEDQYQDVAEGYTACWAHSEKSGYAGVCALTKAQYQPLETISGCGDPEHDAEGRTLTLVYPGVVIVTTYVANAGQKLVRLDYRVNQFDKFMHNYLRELREKYERPVLWVGDLNCAREEIDVWNSKANQKSAGHTPEERASLTSLLEGGEFVDLWRSRNPGFRRYTFWPARAVNSRTRNHGWRLDMFIGTKDLEFGVCEIRDKNKASDHCPVVLSVPEKLLTGK